ncbi:MAG TPA: hypothetical protein VIL48_11160 [Acidimicrobiales bacterium]
MGKASSAKKVARAARAGGRRSAGPRQRNLLFPGVIALIVVLGVALVAYAADERKSDTRVPPVAFEDHWHAAFGIYICDEFLPATPEFESPNGIHTHGDGVIHVHPYTENASGDNATLGVYLEDAGIELSNDELTVNDETYTEGEDTCGEGEDAEEGELVLLQWKNVQDTDRNPARITRDFGDVNFEEDGEGYVLAFVPDPMDADIPKPESADQLAELGAADSGDVGSTTTTEPAEGDEGGEESGDESTTTTAGEDESTTTTAGDGSTTTTAAEE